METKVEIITPELAAKYLEKNISNRRIRQADVDMLARDIKTGNWCITHQGIAFNDAGNLIDGQHRLTAIVQAGIPVKMMVTRGLSEFSVIGVDRGIKRTVNDNLAITGEYNKPWFRSNSVCGAVRQIVRIYSSHAKMSDAEVLRFIETHEAACEHVYHACGTGAKVNSPVMAGALSAVLCGEAFEGIYQFFEVYTKGNVTAAGRYNVMPAINLSKQVLNAKASHVSINRDRLYNLSSNAVWSFLHKPGVRIVKETEKNKYDCTKLVSEFLRGEDNVN